MRLEEGEVGKKFVTEFSRRQYILKLQVCIDITSKSKSLHWEFNSIFM